MKKICFLEGLPGVGKTTIIEKIRNLNLKDVFVVDEIVLKEIFKKINLDQNLYLKNDNIKIDMFKDGTIIIDRGPISTFSYNQARHIIDIDFDFSLEKVESWFKNFIELYKDSNVFVYYLIKGNENYLIRYSNDKDPYGNAENQKFLQEITMFNCKKYVKNIYFKPFNIEKDNLLELINEIIN